MEITADLLKTIYNRAYQYAISKWDARPYTIEIDKDGDLHLRFHEHHRHNLLDGDTSKYIDSDALTSDLDVIVKERLETEERARIDKLIRQEAEFQLKMEMEKAARKQQYLQLKKEFENE